MQNLEQWIKTCEGFDPHSYIDSNGHLTIGWGHNLENGISVDEAELMFQNDLKKAKSSLEDFFWYEEQPDDVKDALINMMFNLGKEKFQEFKQFIKAVALKNYSLAAKEVLDSLWAKQVGQRAKDIAVMISEAKA